ncbi:MAG TPA: hypothetical protein VGI81_26750 [Tepidisphaeraceae bacterium]|jgi:hypothetical protein
MSLLRQSLLPIGLALLLVTVPLARAEWTPPKDNVLTEKQVTRYLQALKQALDDFRAAGNSAENMQSASAGMALYLKTDAKFKANLASRNLTEQEYSWVGERLIEAWGTTISGQVLTSANKGMVEQRKTIQQRLDESKTKLATYEKAQAQGRRVMTKEERQSAIDSAKSDQQSVQDEAKQHDDEIKQFTADAAKADDDAKAADALAKNPPSDVSADDRAGYIEGKKADAQAARDASKDAREKLDEAKKARDESLAKVAAAKKKVADPDLPTTDDEKADVKKQNEETIASLKTEIVQGEQGMKQMDEAMAEFARNMQEQRAKNPVAQQNIDLFKKHQAEWEAAWGIKGETK